MKIIAFACCHISTADTQRVFFEKEMSLEPISKLFRNIIDGDYNLIINCGDLFEPYYEPVSTATALVPELREMSEKCSDKLIHIFGNHDRMNGLATYQSDDIYFTHGHLNNIKFEGKTKQQYHDAVLAYYTASKLKFVFGHTHIAEQPTPEGFPVALGSLLENRTYLEIIDGVPQLQHLSLFEQST